jgi:hypothetical protein
LLPPQTISNHRIILFNTNQTIVKSLVIKLNDPKHFLDDVFGDSDMEANLNRNMDDDGTLFLSYNCDDFSLISIIDACNQSLLSKFDLMMKSHPLLSMHHQKTPNVMQILSQNHKSPRGINSKEEEPQELISKTFHCPSLY